MLNISYLEGDSRLLEEVRALWVKKRKYHEDVSTYFSDKFRNMTFDGRKDEMFEKLEIRVVIAKDVKKDKYVGYCISTIDNKKLGEVESIFVEEEYRRNKIAENLMELSLNWMDEKGVEKKRLNVAVGNEEVMNLYKRFNFQPFLVVLEQKSERV
ncbi:GNAT family N-acetyltransferase [Herbivorax sp. ANBcel31]|uniref:GNAT family N-acetyltransferase n=1 Tax=Herbivorax sp. ANBcel31 TaxID=3069754 RepID=UPI0027AF59CD|nr:GNAT family N-acetyltransferase [Herbivorax sp. ANBcel31]MDQ2088013.1 GNAT family N-acetyltransferase [Herbivorax sp. ANBcel31]